MERVKDSLQTPPFLRPSMASSNKKCRREPIPLPVPASHFDGPQNILKQMQPLSHMLKQSTRAAHDALERTAGMRHLMGPGFTLRRYTLLLQL